MSHSFFSPSAAARWIACPGSMAFAENQVEGGTSKFADDGTASHHWAALCLQQERDAEFFLGAQLEYSTGIYEMDETRASFVQQYLDDVRRRAIGGSLYVEYGVKIPELGETQGGTADTCIYLPAERHLIVEDLKYGTGEKVYAEKNPQLMLYLLGMLGDMRLLGNDVQKVTGVICQPRLGHIDEYTCTLEELEDFGRKAALAVEHAGKAMVLPEAELPPYLSPGEKQCRWCRAKTRCPALARYVADQVKCDFDTINADPAPVAPRDTKQLASAYGAVPLISDWCRAVTAEVAKLTAEGTKVIGPDGLPYKFVEGKQGSRAWSDPVAAEAALLGQLPPDKAYVPQTIITAPAAAKLLDKKATKQLWADIFQPLIKKAPGKAVLAFGSDPRPPAAGSATADDFEEDLTA